MSNISYQRTEDGEAEALVAPATSRGRSTLGWAAFLIGFAVASFAAVTIFAGARKTSAFLGVESKYEKRWRPYSENCITAPQLCPLGTHCMLKDDTWAACLYKDQCRPGKFVKIECEGHEHEDAFHGEKTYCRRWECCTLKEGREPSRQEPVYTDKLPANYRHTEALASTAPDASFKPWQPYCEPPTDGCDTTTTDGCDTTTTTGCSETTVGCEHEESTLPTITTEEDTTSSPTTVAITTEGATTAASTVLSTEGTTTVIESNSVTEKTTEADTTSSTTAVDTTTAKDTTTEETTTKDTTTAVDTTEIDTTVVDTTVVDTTVIDTTVIDTTLVDTTLVDTTVVDTTVVDTTAVDTTVIDTTPLDTTVIATIEDPL